jgi:hypothetical protein
MQVDALAINGNGNGWKATKEKILMFAGLAIVGIELVHAEIFSGTFHLEFLIAGLALCGVSIAQWGDRK